MTEKNQLDSTCGISDDELTRRFRNPYGLMKR